MSATATLKMTILFGHELRAASAAFGAVRTAQDAKTDDETMRHLWADAYRLAELALYQIQSDSHLAVIELTQRDIKLRAAVQHKIQVGLGNGKDADGPQTH